MSSLATADLQAPAPPFEYNPSAWSQRVPVAVLAALGFGIAAYMALYQWQLIPVVWDPIWGDDGAAKVLTSDVAKTMHGWFGFPDAAFGAFAYLGDAVYSMAGSTRRWQYRPWLVVLFGLDVIPLGIVSAVLVVLQGTVVGHWCFLCLVTAVISVSLIPFAADEVWATLKYLRRVWARTRSRRVLWDVFWGRYVEAASEVARPEHTDSAVQAPPRGSMWPRMLELMFGVWLVLSPLIFRVSWRVPSDALAIWAVDLAAGGAVITVSALSMWGRLHRAHLATIAIGVALAAYGYVLAHTGIAAHQNHIVLGLLLVMIAIIPTDATMPPASWCRESKTRAE